jgi:hypothetical protein
MSSGKLVTSAWCFVGLRKKIPSRYGRQLMKTFNEKSWTADKMHSFILGVVTGIKVLRLQSDEVQSLFGLIGPEDDDTTAVRNVGNYLPVDMT